MFRLFLALMAVPVLLPAQTPDATNQKVVEELRGVRATLEKLEKGQTALVALTRIQIDENRVGTLEAQRLQLLSREQNLEKEVTAANAVYRTGRSSAVPTVLVAGPDGPHEITQPDSAAERASEASRKLEEVRRDRQAVERTLSELRQQIAAWERVADEAVR